MAVDQVQILETARTPSINNLDIGRWLKYCHLRWVGNASLLMESVVSKKGLELLNLARFWFCFLSCMVQCV